jgi:hypothetical protein
VLLEVGQLTPGIGGANRQEDRPLLGQSTSGVGEPSGGAAVIVKHAPLWDVDLRLFFFGFLFAECLVKSLFEFLYPGPQPHPQPNQNGKNDDIGYFGLIRNFTSRAAAIRIFTRRGTSTPENEKSEYQDRLVFHFPLLEVGQLTPGVGAANRQEDWPLLGQSPSDPNHEYSDAVSACVEDGSVTVMCL